MAIAALSSGVTGLNASERALGNSAHAIANIGTQGFQPAQANFQENSPAGSGVSISFRGQELLAVDAPSAAPRVAPSATNLATETTNSLVYKAQFDLSAKVIQVADQNLGTLIDTKA